MAVTTEGRLAFEFPFLPDQFVICVENNEVVDIRRRNEVLLASCSRINGPSSEEYDVRTADVGRVSVAGQGRSA